MTERPRCLDLFCGGGGASMGYYRAGYDVVGCDLHDQPDYPFPFVRADALAPPFDLSRFDLIHASPPCQAYSTMTNRWESGSPRLIVDVRAMLQVFGKPYVIENVAGAVRDLENPIRLTGEMFGLSTHRARYFECVPFLLAPEPPPRQHAPVAVYGKMDGRRLWTRADGTEHRAPQTLEPAQEAMGIDWLPWDTLKEAIPPAYTHWIGERMLECRNA